MKDVFSVQGVWHSPNMLPIMAHGQAFRIITQQPHFERAPFIHHRIVVFSSSEHCDLRSREQLTMVKEGLSKLPPAHYQTLKYLVAHFVR
jgi:hypothetical protein